MEKTVPPGYDTVGIAVPIDDFCRVGMDHTIQAEGTDREAHRWSRRLEGGGFLATGMGHKAWIEASLPKRVDPDGSNVEALNHSDMIEALREMYGEAAQHVEVSPGHHWEESKVIRLDLVRDFSGVTQASPILDGLAAVAQPGRSKIRRFADPGRGQAETLRVGPKAWGCTLYDKHAESGLPAAAGQLRFEARLHQDQLRSQWCRKNGTAVEVVGDLVERGPIDGLRSGESAMARAQRMWFDRAGFSHVVPHREHLQQIIAGLGLSATRQGVLWACLTMPGYRQSLSRNTRSTYDRIARSAELGPHFALVEELAGGIAPAVLRLDYVSGQLEAA